MIIIPTSNFPKIRYFSSSDLLPEMHSGTFSKFDVVGSETLGHVQPHRENSSHQPLIPKVPGEQINHTVGLAGVFEAVSLVLAKSAYVARVTRFFDVTANGH